MAQELSDETLNAIAQHFRVLSDPQRLRILHLLQGREMTVGALAETTGHSQPNVSKHLSILRASGLVNRRREGNCAYFSVASPFVFDLCQTVCDGLRDEIERRHAALANT